MESEPMFTPKGKIPFTRKILPREGSNPWRCIKQDSEPNTLPTSYSGPRPHALIKALQSSNFHLGLGDRKKAIPFYFSRHRSSEQLWSKQQCRAPRFFSAISNDVPAPFMLCCSSACKLNLGGCFPVPTAPPPSPSQTHVPCAFLHVPHVSPFKALNVVDWLQWLTGSVDVPVSSLLLLRRLESALPLLERQGSAFLYM